MWKAKEKIRTRKASFVDAVREMIAFFDGFEYGESIIRISKQDYMKNMKYFTVANGKAYAADALVCVDPSVPQGTVFLDSIHSIQEERESA